MQETKIKNLVFEGAGIRGIAYAGVVASLEERELVSNIQRVGGTSAGAIISLLFSLGYTSLEMQQIIANTKFKKFNDGGFLFVGGLARSKKRYGWCKGLEFTEWLGNLISEKTENSEITFEEYHQKGFKELYFVATCLNKQNLVILSHKTYPKMKIKDAVRISMSIPLYYQAVFVDKEGNTFKRQDKDNNLDVMVDGGIIGNFPIFIFDEVIIDEDNNELRIPNPETLGVRIDSEEQINRDTFTKTLVPYKIENFADYISAFYIMVIENLNRTPLTKQDWKRTISVSSVGVSPKVKKLTSNEKQSLVKSGKESVDRFFDEKRSDLKDK